jgi:hypothetical protein
MERAPQIGEMAMAIAQWAMSPTERRITLGIHPAALLKVRAMALTKVAYT